VLYVDACFLTLWTLSIANVILLHMTVKHCLSVLISVGTVQYSEKFCCRVVQVSKSDRMCMTTCDLNNFLKTYKVKQF